MDDKNLNNVNVKTEKFIKVIVSNFPKQHSVISILPILIAFISVVVMFITNENSNNQIILGRKAFIISQLVKEASTGREFLELENVTSNPALDYKLYVLVKIDGQFDTLWVDDSGFTIPGRQIKYFYLDPKPNVLARKNKFGLWQQDKELYIIQRFYDYADPNYEFTKDDPAIRINRYYNLVDSDYVKLYKVINLKDF